jgi:hypothetical protein
MSNHCPTIVLRSPNPVITKKVIKSTEDIDSKTTASKNAQTGAVKNATKIERLAESGETYASPTIPLTVAQLIAKGRIEKGFKTQRELALAIPKPQITQIEIQQMENGKFVLTLPGNREKVQAVGRKLQLGPLDLPKIK